MKLSFTQDKFLQLLAQFQSAIDSGEYTEKIPYDTWRKLKKLRDVRIEFTSPFVRIFGVYTDINGLEKEAMVFSAKVYDWGFGRFFYDYVVKEREKMTLNMKADYMQASDKICSSATSACSTATKADVSGKVATHESITYAGDPWENYGTADAAKLADTYYGTTTTDHTIAIAGEPISSKTIELNIPSLDYLGRWDNGCWDSVASKSDMEDRFNKLEAELQKKVDKAEMKSMEKENKTMMKGINFDFGPCGNTVRLSMYGMAIQNVSGEWVSYNPESREIINVDVFNMADGGKYMYKMPVAISDVAIGDIVIHNRVPMFVTAVNENGTFEVTDVRAGEAKNIIPTRSPFGFNFVTKIVSLFGNMMTPNASNPFGNMWMFALMSDDKSFDMKDMLMLSMMSGNDFSNMNPMMLMLMADNKGDNSDWLMPLMLMNGGLMGQTHTCKCEKTPADAGQI